MKRACVVLLFCSFLFSCSEKISEDLPIDEERVTAMSSEDAVDVEISERVMNTEVDVYSLRKADVDVLNQNVATKSTNGGGLTKWMSRYRDGKMPFVSVERGDANTFEYRITVYYINGVALKSGEELSGKITITVSHYGSNGSSFRSIEYDDFKVNDIMIEGIVDREVSVGTYGGLVISSESQLLFSRNGVVFVSRTASYLTRWTEGMDTPLIWSDDVMETTGSDTMTTDNNKYSRTIVEPVVKIRSCPFPIQGVINVESSMSVGYRIDYGNGACDKEYEITFN
ncbi:hypothetical protein K4L44_16050 [Halosquirtibacter laminarini]|uniref:Uncharacterized protein n=1 Tax=Halosquirtibacter laminarini TaxID=3374600 RepID=A0AC61NR08_9BACT|nr:hypothetical protein K4L44_16050 [Prolixibacteraceae bacterium]